MHKSFVIAFLIVCLVSLAQCTVQKRVYRKGWYVSFKEEWRNPEKDKTEKKLIASWGKDTNTFASLAEIPPMESTLQAIIVTDSLPKPDSIVFHSYLPEIATIGLTLDNEDSIQPPATNSEQLFEKKSKASSRPAWVRKIVIVLFWMAVILFIALLLSTTSVNLANSVVFSAIMLVVLLLAFIITIVYYNRRDKPKKNLPQPEQKKRLMTPEEQLERKKFRMRTAIVLTFFLGIIFLILALIATSIGSFLFLIPSGIMVAVLIFIAWFEFLRHRPFEITTDVVAPEKQYRQKTAEEKQFELKKHNRKSLASIVFFIVVLLVVLLNIPLYGFSAFTLFVCLMCLALIAAIALSYFNWKQEDIIEIEAEPQDESSSVEEDRDPVKPKRAEISEERQKSNHRRSFIVLLFFAIVAAFFIIDANS